MALRTFRFSGFVGGLYATANIFDQPKGSLPRLSNLTLQQRGGLQTVRGSHALVSPVVAGAYPPIRAIVRYNPTANKGPSQRFIVTVGGLNEANIYDASGATWQNQPLYSASNAAHVVGGVQFHNDFVFALGLKVPPVKYDGSVFAPIVNTFQPNTNYPPWLGSTLFPKDAVIFAFAGGQSYLFQALNQGTTGATAPAWPTALNATVTDNQISWKNIGQAGPAGPPGAHWVFNHDDSLWIWGTAPDYTAPSKIDGPDSLRMSDSGDPTSWDPSNQTFIGRGDGQDPRGGAIWTQLEVGIPANAQLVLFKSLSDYLVLGSFPNVQISAVPNGVGCAAPNTIQLVPNLGIFRLSEYGVALFDGTRDQVEQFTDPIRYHLWGGPPDITPVDWNSINVAFAVQTFNPPGYLMVCPIEGGNGQATRGFFFDRLLKAWTVIDFPMGLSSGLFDIALPGAPQILAAGYSDGVVRAIFDGDYGWDTAPQTPVQWSLRTTPVGAPGTPIYIRRLVLRGRTPDPNANANAIVLDQNRRGIEASRGLPASNDAPAISAAFDVDRTVLGGVMFDIVGQGQVTLEGVEVHYQPKPVTRIPA